MMTCVPRLLSTLAVLCAIASRLSALPDRGDARQPAGLQVPSRLKDNQPVFRQQQQQQQQQLNQQNQPQVLNQQQVPSQVKQQLEGVNVQHQQSANAAPPPAASRRGKESKAEQKIFMDQLSKQRQEDQRAAQESAFRQSEAQRQQQQLRVQQQQAAIRQQLEQQKQFQLQQHQQELLQQHGDRSANANNNDKAGDNSNKVNVNDNNNAHMDNNNAHSDNKGDKSQNDEIDNTKNINSNIDAYKQNQPDPPQKKMYKVPTPRPSLQDVGGAGAQVGGGESDSKAPVPPLVHKDTDSFNSHLNNEQDKAPDEAHESFSDNRWGGREPQEGFQRQIPGQEESNQQEVPVQRFPAEQPMQDGGMHLNWDWDDFSLTFENYGAAEMKVRRAPHATTGEPWPLPQYYTKKDNNILVVDPNFDFTVNSNFSCDIIDQAVIRYKQRIKEHAMEDMYDNLQNAAGTFLGKPEKKYAALMYRNAPVITKFSLKIRKPCTIFPSMDSDESYDLVVKKSAAYLWANEVWGLLRGLETLSQLIWRGLDDRLYVKESVVSDYPRFPHRGILIDSSRHFIFKEVLYDMMDAMEMNKMNVMHWHIVDDQSFPYQSQVYPELSKKGAYHPTYVYSLKDIADLLEYGRMRGIRILPEFDSPGHTYAWGLSRPELLTQCYSGNTPVKGYLGPIYPVHNSTYKFLKNLFHEVLTVFKDEFIHLGGDEVPLGCWQSNPEVVKFGEKLSQKAGIPTNDQSAYFGGPSPSIRLVYEYYVNRLMKDIKELGEKRNGIKFIMWQEVMNNDLKLPNDTLIQVWMGDMADVSRAISMGYNVLYSSCWYLDHVEYGVKWPKYYTCDPADNSYGYNIDEKKVKGGEACLWSEYIDNENLIQTTWPRASAVAERLWSSKETRNLDLAGERLSEHRCRMLRRGLSVGQISGPDYCLKRGPGRHQRASGCQGNNCRSQPEVVEKSDINFRLRSEGRTSSECTWLFQIGGNITILAIVAVIAFVILMSVSRSSGKLNPLRTCRHRTIVIIFAAVVLIYFMCYTTIWMHVFEFSGSYRKKQPASFS